MQEIVSAIQSEYMKTWHDVVTGGILWMVLYYAIGAAAYFLFSYLHNQRYSLRSLHKMSLRELMNYIIQPNSFRSSSGFVDKVCWVFSLLWGPFAFGLFAALSLTLGVYVEGLLVRYFGARAPIFSDAGLLALTQATALFLLTDFLDYWDHWLLHKVPFLWAFHRVHHSTEDLTIFSSFRIHPLQGVYEAVATGVAFGILSAPILYFTGVKELTISFPIFLIVARLFDVSSLLGHSHVPVSLGRLNYVITSPIMHQIHHSAETRHLGRNLGVRLFIWDWMFGTIYIPKPAESFRFGLSEAELGGDNPHSKFHGLLLEPVVYALRALRRKQPESLSSVPIR